VIRFDQFEHASLTDVGIRRSHNQDNHTEQLANDEEQWRQRGHLFLVADGMGAHAVGEKASEQAVRVIPHTYLKHAQQGAAAALRKAFIEANASIHAFGTANREFQGTGTTGTALLLRPEGAWIGHVGDSRVYRIRNGVIDQLSYDHSLLWEYARIKGLDPDDVVDIPANVIHRCLGPEPVVKVDVEGPHALESGDIFLLCSDGLSGQISDTEIGVVATLLPPTEACRFLVDLANLRGGPDNITVQIIRVKEGAESNGVAPARPGWSPTQMPRIPWWMATLLGGAILSGAAAYMAVNKIGGNSNIPTFMLGAVAIMAGLIGLLLHSMREREEPEKPAEDEPKPRIHRSRPCHLEQPLMDKLVRALVNLRQAAYEKKADPDWTLSQTHQALGEKLVGEGDIPGAFREYCLAVLPITAAMNKIRKKEEVFRPLWDKWKDPPGQAPRK
jgi:PPM family protein phosphatase